MERRKKLVLYLAFVLITISSLIIIIKISKSNDLPKITLISPTDGEILNDRNVILKWKIDYKRPLTLMSILEISKDNVNFHEIYNGLDTEYEIPLEPGTYFWKIKSKFGAENIETPVSSFTISNTPPEIEYAKESISGYEVKFEWNAIDDDYDSLSYKLYIYDSLGSETRVELDKSFYLTSLPAGKYSWKIVCIDEYGAKAESSLREFEIGNSKVENEIENVDFKLEENDSGYLVSFDYIDEYEYILEINNDEILLDSGKYLIEDLKPGKYKIRLKVKTPSGKEFYSEYKEIIKEKPKVKNTPPSFEIIFPKDNLNSVSRKIIFKWKVYDREDEPFVNLYIGEDKTNLKKVIENYKANIFEYKNLKENTTYYWQLEVSDGENIVKSKIHKFITSPLVKIVDVIGSQYDDIANDAIIYDDMLYVLYTSSNKVKLLNVDNGYELDLNVFGQGVDLEEKDGILYILANTSNKDFIILAIKKDVILWKKTFGGKFKDVSTKMIVDEHAIYVLGYTWSEDFVSLYGWSDVFLLKLTRLGDLVWVKHYGGTLLDEAVDMAKINGGVIIAGNTTSKDKDIPRNYGTKDIFVMCVDNFGKVKWARVFGSKLNDMVTALKVNENNVYVASKVFFDKLGNETSNSNIYLLKLDLNGTKLSEEIIGGSGNDICYDLEFIDNDIYLFGTTSSRDGDFWNASYSAKGFFDFFVLNKDKWNIVNGGYENDEIKCGIMTKSGIILIGNTSSHNGLFNKYFGNSDVFIGRIER